MCVPWFPLEQSHNNSYEIVEHTSLYIHNFPLSFHFSLFISYPIMSSPPTKCNSMNRFGNKNSKITCGMDTTHLLGTESGQLAMSFQWVLIIGRFVSKQWKPLANQSSGSLSGWFLLNCNSFSGCGGELFKEHSQTPSESCWSTF